MPFIAQMFKLMWPLLAFLICVNAFMDSNENSEAMAARSYFYVGGKYVPEHVALHLLKDQMYVEKLVPLGGAKHKYPLVFVHGTAQTGATWLNTPDGRKGWASWFLEQGYVVYLVDQPQRGRSDWLGDGSLTTFSAEEIEALFTRVELFKLWPQASLHTQWPGVRHSPVRGMIHKTNTTGKSKTGLKGDPVFDAFYASHVQYQKDDVITQTINQHAGAALLDLVGPAIMITHSQGGALGFAIADARPTQVKALISLEPQGPPFVDRFPTKSNTTVRPYGLTTIPITYEPAVTNATTDLVSESHPPEGPNLSDCFLQKSPARKLTHLAQFPHLIVDSEASYHAVFDYCTVRYLQQAGVSVDFLNLSAIGIHGNAHMLFAEKNNLQIAAEVEAWIRSNVTASP